MAIPHGQALDLHAAGMEATTVMGSSARFKICPLNGSNNTIWLLPEDCNDQGLAQIEGAKLPSQYTV